MTYFEDLSEYVYTRSGKRPETLRSFVAAGAAGLAEAASIGEAAAVATVAASEVGVSATLSLKLAMLQAQGIKQLQIQQQRIRHRART